VSVRFYKIPFFDSEAKYFIALSVHEPGFYLVAFFIIDLASSHIFFSFEDYDSLFRLIKVLAQLLVLLLNDMFFDE